jgi:hypothetical protein
VSQNTFLGLFWPTGSYVAHGMRMTVLSMFFVLIATPLGSHGGSCLVVHSGHPPHIVTHLMHEYHVNTPHGFVCHCVASKAPHELLDK